MRDETGTHFVFHSVSPTAETLVIGAPPTQSYDPDAAGAVSMLALVRWRLRRSASSCRCARHDRLVGAVLPGRLDARHSVKRHGRWPSVQRLSDPGPSSVRMPSALNWARRSGAFPTRQGSIRPTRTSGAICGGIAPETWSQHTSRFKMCILL